MPESCRFFDSDRWADRLVAAADRAWEVEDLLERFEDHEEPTDAVERLRAAAERDAAEGIRDLVGASDGAVTLSPADAAAIWAAVTEQDFPEVCPHEPVDDAPFCVFHLRPDERAARGVTADELAAAVVDRVHTDKRSRVFVGATFETLDLAYETLSAADKYPIDCRLVSVTGTLSLADSVVTHDLLLHGAELAEVSFERAELNGYLGGRDTAVAGRADFDYAKFGRKVEFWNASFAGPTSFYAAEFDDYGEFRRASFAADADFKYTTFRRDAEFWDARFDGDVTFHTTQFGGYAEFRGATIVGEADFKYTSFARDAEFWDATFGGDATFYAAEFDNYAEFKDADFWGQCTFRYAAFDRDAEFWYATFESRADFRDATFDASAEFDETVFDDGADFRNARLADAQFDETTTGGAQIDLIQADIESGRCIQPDTSVTFYNLRGATLGDVDLVADRDDVNLFEFFRFYDTQFAGFDFPGHRDALNPTWEIHRFGGTLRTPDTAGELESTYLKAKNGAAQSGDTAAAAEFFLKEMKYRRRGHLETIRDGTERPLARLLAGLKWSTNWFYNLTCGYGERPLRTIGFSLGLIVLFGLGYWLIGIQSGAGNFLAYLTFSLQSFVTLILGEVPGVQSVVVRLLAAFEAFLGAFFIALFVFALVRSIRR